MAVTGGIRGGRSWPSAVISIVWPIPSSVTGRSPRTPPGWTHQVVQPRAVELVGLLEAVDEGPALDGHAAADRVHAPVRVGPARGQVQVQVDHVALSPGAVQHVVAGETRSVRDHRRP